MSLLLEDPDSSPPALLSASSSLTWSNACSGDEAARADWRAAEEAAWNWGDDGVTLEGNGTEWMELTCAAIGRGLFTQGERFRITITVSGVANAAGISFGPYKDFLATPLEADVPARIELEVDPHANVWRFQSNLHPQGRQWWDSGVSGVKALTSGTFTLKARWPQRVHFSRLHIEMLSARYCQFSVIVTCYRFLQRLRATLRNWCHQNLPIGSFEIIIVNPDSPDGTHEYLSSVISAFPHVRIVEVKLPGQLAKNKGAMINAGAQASRGEWIWLSDADCLYSPDAGALMLEHVRGSADYLYYAERRFLTGESTRALLTGRLDSLRDFEALANSPMVKAPESEPYGYTQIVHRSVFQKVQYTRSQQSFAWSDLVFRDTCAKMGVLPSAVPGLRCLHLDHPFSWNGASGFL